MDRDSAEPSFPHEVTPVLNADQSQGTEDTDLLLPNQLPDDDPHVAFVPDHGGPSQENHRKDLLSGSSEIVEDDTATAPPQHQGMSQRLDVETGR